MNKTNENSEYSERQNLLNECYKLRLHADKDDDLELLQLIFETAMERNSDIYDLNSDNNHT